MSEGQDWIYSDIVKEHFLNPRNFLMGDESKFDYDAVGLVGNPICGDQMKMFIKVKDDRIVDVRWKTYGCASAIASTSALSEIAKGKTLDEALKISAEDIAKFKVTKAAIIGQFAGTEIKTNKKHTKYMLTASVEQNGTKISSKKTLSQK